MADKQDLLAHAQYTQYIIPQATRTLLRNFILQDYV